MSGERTCIQQLLKDLDKTLEVGRDDCDNDSYSDYLNAIHDVKIRLRGLIAHFGVREPGQCTLKATRSYIVVYYCHKHGFSSAGFKDDLFDSIFDSIDKAVEYATKENKKYSTPRMYFCVVDLATNREVWNPKGLDLWQEDYGEFKCPFDEDD